MILREEIKAFHERSEASVRQYLRSKSWPEKVRSIERMNEFSQKARIAMRAAIAGSRSKDAVRKHSTADTF